MHISLSIWQRRVNLTKRDKKKEKQKGKTQQQIGGVKTKNQAWCTKMFRVFFFFSKFKLKPIRFWLFSIFCFSVVRKITKLREESGSDDETRIKWWIYIYKWFSQPSLSLTHSLLQCVPVFWMQFFISFSFATISLKLRYNSKLYHSMNTTYDDHFGCVVRKIKRTTFIQNKLRSSNGEWN